MMTVWDIKDPRRAGRRADVTGRECFSKQVEAGGREGGVREGTMCSGRRERDVFPKQKPSFQLKGCLTCCHHQKSLSRWSRPVEAELRRFVLFLHRWFNFYWVRSFLFFKHNRVSSRLHGGDGGKSVFTSLKASYSASRELQELPDAPPPTLSSFPLWLLCLHFHSFSGFDKMKLYWSSYWNWVIAAAAGTGG